MITPQPKTARILLLDTTQQERRSLSLGFAHDPFIITETNTVDSALTLLASDDIHLFLLYHDPEMPPAEELVQRMRRAAPAVEMLVILPEASPETIAAVLNAGAFDCLDALPSTEELMARARKAIEHRELKVQLTAVREHVAMNYSFDNLIGISRAMEGLRATLTRLAPTDIPILISGPDGAGKTLCARVLHHHSERRNKPILIVDCSAPEPILLAELLGTSGSDRPGLIRQADGGTLVLKNIESMPASVQDHINGFMKTFTLPGETAKLRVRIISTSRLASAALAAGSLRRELLARLNVITVDVPPLTDRVEDIEMLIDYDLRKIAAESNRDRLMITRAAVDRLLRWSWPGNVRELENTLRRAAALSVGDTLDHDSLVFIGDTAAVAASTPPTRSVTLRLIDNQRELIEKALVENNWNYTQTAQELGIGRTTLWRKVKKYGLKPDHELEQVT